MKRLVLLGRPGGALAHHAEAAPDLSPLSKRIFRIVDQDGALREKQIPELAAIRERIRRYREDADRSVRGLLDEHASRGYWQTTTPTQRDGRVVLPLKAQYKGTGQGIVHELSSSGSTVFIEPLEIVEKNNAIVQEENLYRIEVRRILRELTAEVSQHAGELAVWSARFRRWTAGWRGQGMPSPTRVAGPSTIPRGFPSSMRGTRSSGAPSCPSRSSWEATRGCSSSPVRTPAARRSALKTVGILALMNQFGMEIPAAEGSALPLFDSIFADIGDEQSIEQSLSTFPRT